MRREAAKMRRTYNHGFILLLHEQQKIAEQVLYKKVTDKWSNECAVTTGIVSVNCREKYNQQRSADDDKTKKRHK